MLLAAVVALCALTVPMLGGRLMRLTELRFRHVGLLVAALGIQVVIISVAPQATAGLGAPLHLLTYALAAWFLVANRHVPGLLVIGVGGAVNFLAIAANGGVMPASRSALATAGLPVSTGEWENSAAMADARLGFLGDVFAVPGSLPLANVFSVGDILIVVGAGYLLHRVAGSRVVPSGERDPGLLRQSPDFRRLWAAHAVSCMGDWVYAVAVFATLGQRDASPGVIAALLAVQLAPAALTGLLGGPLVDRLSRKSVMIAADVLRALAVGSLLLAGEPSVAHLYAVAAMLGVFGALFQPSLQASLPNVLPEERLVAGNAYLNANFNLAVTLGPVLGGLLASQLGGAPAFALNAASFAVSAVLVARVGLARAPADSSAEAPVRSLVEGLAYSIATPVVRGILIVTGLVMLAVAVRSPLEPIFIIKTLEQSPEALGLVGAAWGLGMLLASPMARSATGRMSRERILAVGLAGIGGCVIWGGLSTELWMILLLWLAAGFGNGLVTICYESLLQERTPDRLRGRVIAASEAVLDAGMVAGLLATSWLATMLGIRASYVLSGALFVAIAAVAVATIKPDRSSRPAAERVSALGHLGAGGATVSPAPPPG
jgi:MFS family permease